MAENKIMTQSDWKCFSALPEAYGQILNTVTTAARQSGLSEQLQMKLELGAEEAVVNIIKHAYGTASGCIWIRTSYDAEKFVLEIADSGKRFNPLKHTQQQGKELGIDKRQPGGYGVQFMKWIFDELDYKYDKFKGNNANHLMLVLKYK